MALPKLVITDIDGVWTDGGMYYDKGDNEFKKFNTSDSAGVTFCKLLKIPVGIITGENTPIVRRRAEKLKIDIVYLGIGDKLAVLDELLKKHEISADDVAYIGDDINDIEILKAVGFSASPKNAPDYVKKHVDFVTKKSGGEGAFREFVEYILERENVMEETLKLFLEAKKLNQ